MARTSRHRRPHRTGDRRSTHVGLPAAIVKLYFLSVCREHHRGLLRSTFTLHSSPFALSSSRRRLAVPAGAESALQSLRLAVQKHAILGADPACVTTGRTTEDVRGA